VAVEVTHVDDRSSRITDETSELVRGRVNGQPTSDIKPSLSSWKVTSITPICTINIYYWHRKKLRLHTSY